MDTAGYVSYIPLYKKYIQRYYSHTKSRIKKGNILRIRYKNAPHNDNPHLFVLNPNYEGKMHALVIDYIQPVTFISLLYNLGIKYEPNPSRDIVYTARRVMDSQDPYSMYHDTIKSFIRRRVPLYRTYFFNKISGVVGVTMDVKQILIDTSQHKSEQ